jgi:hypothetical protein
MTKNLISQVEEAPMMN